MTRRWELDALRGLMLVLMALTHLPTRFSDPFGQPFGFVSAAEGFVFLSAYMAGDIYTRRNDKRGEAEMKSAFWRRALKLYVIQVALLVFAFSVIALAGALAHQSAVTNLLDFYFQRPLTALAASLLLLYNPPLLDILPMYVLFMLLSPVALLHGLRHGWTLLMAASVALWLLAQFDVGASLHEAAVLWLALPVPLAQTGAFDVLAWQLLWMLGLWMGAQDARGESPVTPFPRWLLRTAIAVALICLAWRHAIGQAPFGGHAELNLMFDKWQLGPLRLIDFFALLVLVLHFGPRVKAALPRMTVLETLGRAALPVFCAHLVAVLVALAWVGQVTPERPWSVDLVVLFASLAAMWLVALAVEGLEAPALAARERLSAQRWSAWASSPGPGDRR